MPTRRAGTPTASVSSSELLVRGRLPDGGFRRDPRDEQLSLWPTALAIHALVKAYENEELVKYESAAIAAAAALDALRADGRQLLQQRGEGGERSARQRVPRRRAACCCSRTRETRSTVTALRRFCAG